MAPSVPEKMKALAFDEAGDVSKLHVIDDRPVPQMGSENALDDRLSPVLCKVECAGLNPVDVMELSMGFGIEKFPHVLGCDMAGTVVDAPEGGKWKPGQKVWAFTGVAKPGGATLAEYCSVPSASLAEVPSNISMQGASTLGCAGIAACIGLWQELGLSRGPAPQNASTPVLVYGAASCLGMFAVQLLHVAGYHIIAVASKKNHDMLSKLGATKLYDYHDSDYLDAMGKEPKHKGLKVALDAIGKDTAGHCFAAFEKCGTPAGQGHVVTVRPKDLQKEELKSKPDSELSVVLELFHIYDPTRKHLEDYTNTLNQLVAAGKVVPSPVSEFKGLDGAKEGLQKLLDGKTSAEKCVVTL